MQSVFSVVCVALFAQKIFSLPTLPSSDDAGLSADLGLDPNQLSTVGTDPGPSFSSLDAPPSDNPEASLSQQLALVDPGCNKTPKAKRETGVVGTTCPADFTNSSPKKTPEGQQQNSVPQRPTNATPKKPGRKGDLRLTPSEEPFRNQYGSEEQDSKCPLQYKYTVCGIADLRYDTWGTLFTLSEADLVINYGFGHGMIVHPGKFFNFVPFQKIPPLTFMGQASH